MTTIAIVGAGLLGRLMAWQLACHYQVTLLDKETRTSKNNAAYTAAGLLTPFGESLTCEPDIVAMGSAALTRWPQILSELSAPVDFQAHGSLCVSHQQDNGDYLRFIRHIEQHYPQAQLTKLSTQALQEVAPDLTQRFNQAAFLPNEGCINNHQLLDALADDIISQGVNWRENTEVLALAPHQVTTSCGSESFDLVIDCRGVGATATASQQSPLTDLRPVRGEVIRVYAPEVNLPMPVRLMHPRYKLYIAPKQNHEYAIGSTEIESGASGNVTVRSALELLSALYSLHPGFAEANIIEKLSQFRPAFSDNKPRIFNQAGLLQLNGLYRHGYLLAPIMLDIGIKLCHQQLGQIALSQQLSTNQQFVDALVTSVKPAQEATI